MSEYESGGEPRPGPPGRTAAVVLAAGASTRLGRPKQLISLGNETLLRRTVRLAAEAGCAPVAVVLGFAAERLRSELAGLPAIAVENEGWQQGMGTSLRRGMEAVREMEPEPDQVLVLVCDQPRLTADHLRALLDRHQRGGTVVTASLYAGRAGVPAVFAAELFPELLAMEGDRGARDLIGRQGERLATVDWPDGALDLDRPEDVERLARD